jgi:hypothetical protein
MSNQHWTGRPCAGFECDRVLRSKMYPVELAAGTHRAAGRGMCARCYGRTRDVALATGSPLDLLARVHASSLEYFLNTRRRRGVPEAGLLGSAL